MSSIFRNAIASSPRAYDCERGQRGVVALGLSADHPAHPLIAGTAGCSPYLLRLMERESAFCADALNGDPEQTWNALLASAQDAANAGTMADLMRNLRVAKNRGALFIALCDIGGVWPLDQVLRAISDLADTCINAAVNWLLAEAARKGRPDLDADDPVGSSGFIVLGLGKLGGHELNYSSDVDLILFFDHEGRDPADYGARKQAFNRLTRDFVKILSENTADGYVYRVDLRLRPDPGSTTPCLSVDAAERYYESFGKNWERAAFIKARVIGGDTTAGEAFLDGMKPFVWRRYLDFATLEDVRDMKRLIHKHKGHGEITVAGHDLKLGRGGIREIEFFAQTQQLIAGGRDPALRVKRTVEALDALTAKGWVEADTRDELSESYAFLRMLEHRLQMVDDAQTHKMPTTPEDLERIAAFAGFEGFDALDAALRRHLERVAARFKALFEGPDDGPENEISLFSGDLESVLAGMGFAEPAKAADALRNWGDGAINATKSPRARAKLERLIPSILSNVSGAHDPDRALAEFDRFLSGLPAGVQILSLFEANPALLEMLTEICAAAPRLAAYLGRNAGVLDAVLARDFFAATPDADALVAEYEALPKPEEPDFEDHLNTARRWSKEHHFRIGAALLRGVDTPEEAGRAYSNLAEACLRAMTPVATAELARRHGNPPGVGACVLAMGRLGSGEMTSGSDLDLIVIYDDGDESSDGKSPLSGTQYYARWTQRLVNAMTAQTAEGAVYEVDMRLRPSGKSGPLATRLGSFERYQTEQAWTWEHMALTRARVISGPQALRTRTQTVIDAVLSKQRDRTTTLHEALDMRTRLADANAAASADPWNMKLTRGGLADIDFIVQALLLTEGCADQTTIESLPALHRLCEAKALSADTCTLLGQARHLQATLLHFIRLSHDGRFIPDEAPPALKAVIARALGAGDFAEVSDRLMTAQQDVREAFVDVFGGLTA